MGAGAGRRDDIPRCLLEYFDRMLCNGACILAESCVEGGLSAAGLLTGKIHTNAEAVKKDYVQSYERLLETHQKFSERINKGEFEELLAKYKDNLARATKKKVNGLEQFRKIMTDAAIAKTLDEKISAFIPLENANKHITTLI